MNNVEIIKTPLIAFTVLIKTIAKSELQIFLCNKTVHLFYQILDIIYPENSSH